MTTAREVTQATESVEPAIANAYLLDVAAVIAAVSVSEVEALAAQGDGEGIADLLEAVGIVLLLEAIRSAFMSGGRFEAVVIKIPGRPRPVFDIRAPAADTWLREHTDTLLQRLRNEQRDAVRETVAAGIARQATPRNVALDIVGRLSPQTGRRVGGVIGLAGSQAGAIANAKAQLLSGDTNALKKYLTRERRDRRLDGIVNRAIKARKPVSKADADRIASRYAERLLRTRTEQLAKSEALAAMGAGRDMVYRQLGIAADRITKTWRSRGDLRVRHSHQSLDGTRVGLNAAFQSETGAQLLYPGDTTLGAGPADVIGCRCSAIYHVRFN